MRLLRKELLRIFAKSAFLPLVLLCLAHSNGQSQLLLNVGGSHYPVVDVEGVEPIVLAGGKRIRQSEGSLMFDESPAYTDGMLRLLSKHATLGTDYGSSMGDFYFHFSVVVEGERDFEFCYILILIDPEYGEDIFKLYEIEDIPALADHVIDIRAPVSAGFGGGSVTYFIYSGGEEIFIDDPDRKTAVADPSSEARDEDIFSGKATEETILADGKKLKMPDYPESLIGSGESGFAQVEYKIGRDGSVVEIVRVAGDRIEFVTEAYRAVMESEYRPTMLNDEPLATRVMQNFSFNEFVSFAEAVVVLPYSQPKDRSPAAFFRPAVEYSPNAAIGKAQVDLRVDKLGRVIGVRVIESTNDAIVAAIESGAKEWIFLPAVSGGQVVESWARVNFEHGK